MRRAILVLCAKPDDANKVFKVGFDSSGNYGTRVCELY